MWLRSIRPRGWGAATTLAGLAVLLAAGLVSLAAVRAQNVPPVESTAVATIETRLEPGFNLVGWVDIPTSIDTAFQDLDARVTAAFTWDAGAQAFRSARRDGPAFVNDLETLFTGEGVWLFVEGDQPLFWSRQVVLEEHTQGLAPGMNLVTWLGPDGASARDATATIGSLLGVSSFDAATKTFLSYGPNRPGFLNTLDTLLLGAGLWIEVSHGEQWALPGADLDPDALPDQSPDPGTDQGPTPPACAPRGADPPRR